MAIWGAGIMIGPIVGPTLGGWLTDAFTWRWTFYVNLPVGIVAFMGVLAFMPETARRIRSFDMIGFGLLALFIGALQMMLDRGEQLDWFSSPEVLIEAALAVSAIWMFVIHIVTTDHPFIDLALLKDRNFATGLIFIFTIGIILLATMALLPPMLQNVLGYPTVTSGLVLAPRGVGTMISMIVVGRLVHRVDTRLLILAGLILTAVSLYDMTAFSPDMGSRGIVVTGVIQGLGLGLVFVPLSTIAFATLRPDLRTEASSLFSLVRNIGSSIGISIVATILSQSTRINHAELAEHVSPFNRAIDGFAMPGGGTLAQGGSQTLAWVDALVTKQALMIGYLNDFKLMTIIVLLCIPMLLLLRAPSRASQGEAVHAAME
jgi:DHA2 family multidrug resistance protein